MNTTVLIQLIFIQTCPSNTPVLFLNKMTDRQSTAKSFETINLESQPESIPIDSEKEYNIYWCWSVLISCFKKLWTASKKTFSEFCVYSSIHGLTHFHNPVWYEKLVFNVFLIASIISCCLIMHLVRYERLESPIIMSYDEKTMTINDIPFPAITICPQVKASHEKFDCAGKGGEFLGSLIKDQDL